MVEVALHVNETGHSVKICTWPPLRHIVLPILSERCPDAVHLDV
jgi:hypothetical protein